MKSEFKLSRLFNITLILFGLVVICIFTIKIFIKISIRGFKLIDFTFLSLFFIIIYIAIVHLKAIKYLIINNQKECLWYYSILFPFGKALYFKDYIGIYQTTETGTSGSYKVLYLVDKNNITSFKIIGFYYKNMDEIMKVITLPKIRKNLSSKEYFKLLFIGKINLSEIENKKNVESKITVYIKVFVAISFLIFIIGMLIRLLTKS